MPHEMMGKKVLVKAWFDYRAFEAEVIGSSSGDFGRTMLLVSPIGVHPSFGAACWRSPDDCKEIH